MLFLILVSGLNIEQIAAQEIKQDKEARRLAMIDFNTKYDNEWKIRWNEKTGTPNNIKGSGLNKYKGTPEEIALEFFRDEKKMLGISNAKNELSLTRKYSEEGMTSLTYSQIYKGIPVLGASYLIIIENGNIEFLSGDYYPDIKLDTNPVISASEALRSSQTELTGINILRSYEPELHIYVKEMEEEFKYHLVYHFSVFTDSGDYTLNIDANTGEVVSKTNAGNTSNFASSVGSGYEVAYTITPFTNDMSLTNLDTQSPLKLENDFFYVVDADESVAEADTNFVYSESNNLVKHVMAYYHANKLRTYMVTAGMNSTYPRWKIQIIVNSLLPGYKVAQFFTDFTYDIFNIDLGEEYSQSGYSINNAALDGTIIAHEAAHSCMRSYYADRTSGGDPYPFNYQTTGESKAVEEAYADYFSLSSHYPYAGCIIGKGLEYTWPGGTYFRSHSNYMTKENSTTYDPHDEGMILGGAMWDFSTDYRIDKETVDHLILHTVSIHDSSPSFLDVYDRIEYQITNHGLYGDDYDAFDEAFFKHGIEGEAPDPPDIIGPTNLRQQNEWEVNENPIIEWDALSGASSYSVYRRQLESEDWYLIEIDDQVFSTGITTTSFTDNTFTMRNHCDDFYYRVTAIVSSTESDSSNIISIQGDGFEKKAIAVENKSMEKVPHAFSLSQNYPNPFNPVTQINYTLPSASHVTLKIYNILGQEIAHLVNTNMPAGIHSAKWDASNVASGTYIYKIVAGEFTAVKRMVVIK